MCARLTTHHGTPTLPSPVTPTTAKRGPRCDDDEKHDNDDDGFILILKLFLKTGNQESRYFEQNLFLSFPLLCENQTVFMQFITYQIYVSSFLSMMDDMSKNELKSECQSRVSLKF